MTRKAPLSRGQRMGLNARLGTSGHGFETFQASKSLFPETALLGSRSSAQHRRGRITQSSRRCCPIAGGGPPVAQSIGRPTMSKRLALFSAAAFAALALTAAVVAAVSAQDKMMTSEMSGEKTVMVGGAAMFPSKNIIQNAVNSKDHTTLVAAVKAARLVVTLGSKGPVTVFWPTNAPVGKPPARTGDNPVK